MAITIGSNSVACDGNFDLRVNTSTVVENFYNGFAGGNANQPAFIYHGTSTWTYLSANTWNEFTNGIWGGPAGQQKGAGSYGMQSNFRYYAPRSGYYYFHTDIYTLCDTNNTANYVHLLFGRNGSVSWNNSRTPYTIYGHGNNRGAGSSYPSGPNISAVMFLSEGQYCSVYMYKGNSTSTRFYGAHSFFCGHLTS